VQIGTAYLFTPEARISPLHRDALGSAQAEDSVITNVFTGRPARGIRNRMVEELGPLSAQAPTFPNAANYALPLRKKAEAGGSSEFTPLWSGQAGPLGRVMPAGELTKQLAEEALERLHDLQG
jgi:nitronate monooxygenase